MKDTTQKCEPMDIILTSNPPQYKCKKCGQTWYSGSQTPMCKPTPHNESVPKLPNVQKLSRSVSEPLGDIEIPEVQDGGWKEGRKNLLAMATMFPGSLIDCLDSAYVAGLDDSKEAIQTARDEERKKMVKKISDLTTITRVYENPWNNGYFDALENMAQFLSEQSEEK